MLKNNLNRLITVGIMILSLAAIGCAAKKSEWGDLQSGLVLKYRFPQEQTLTYKSTADTIQNLEVMGNSMETTIKSGTSYGIKGTGVDDQNNLMAEVIINHINIAISSPQGNLNPDTSGLNGKGFGATFSPAGKELETTGTENLPKISLGMSGERDAKELFSDILPILPDVPVKTGESWTTPIEKNLQQGQISISIKGEATNVIEEIATVMGMECVKINTTSKNAVQGSGTQMGQELNLKGEITGTSTWYFAYKKGMFVKLTGDEDSEIKINVGSMEIPQKTKSKTEVQLML
jgi:hypothetical protein